MAGFDLLVRGGRVIDPAQDLDEILDVAFRDGRVAAVAPRLPSKEAHEVLDAGRCLVVPGLIDLHTHLYWGATALGVDADAAGSAGGVTTLVDAGSAGAGNFAGFHRFVIEGSRARVFAFLNIAFPGIYAFGDRVRLGEAADERLLDVASCVETARRHRQSIRGIKVRLGRHGSGTRGLASLAPALAAAAEAELPLMVHIDEPPPTLREVVGALRPGDILTHVYRPLTDESPEDVIAGLRDARQRGVITDVAHGQGSFSFAVARAALEKGLGPDVISSDLHRYNIRGPARDLLTTMAKFRALGLSWGEIIESVTVRPAGVLGRTDLGTLTPGSAGDAAIFRLETGEFPLEDCGGDRITGGERLVPRAVIREGRRWRSTVA